MLCLPFFKGCGFAPEKPTETNAGTVEGRHGRLQPHQGH